MRLQHEVAFAKLTKSKPCRKTDVPSEVPPEVTVCKLCNVEKHTCCWLYTNVGKLRKTIGGSCYSCYQATRLLQCTRSVELLRKAGLDKVVAEVSACVRRDMGTKRDQCRCHKCTTTASSVGGTL